MLEKDIEKKLSKGIKELGGLYYKWTSPGNSGVPDRIIMMPNGNIVFAELKTDDGELSAVQRIQIGKIRKMGFQVYVIQGLAGLDRFLDIMRYTYHRKEVMPDEVHPS